MCCIVGIGPLAIKAEYKSITIGKMQRIIDE
jgi:hypothetical protein